MVVVVVANGQCAGVVARLSAPQPETLSFTGTGFVGTRLVFYFWKITAGDLRNRLHLAYRARLPGGTAKTAIVLGVVSWFFGTPLGPRIPLPRFAKSSTKSADEKTFAFVFLY